MGLDEKKTLTALENAKAHFLVLTYQSFLKLKFFLEEGLIDTVKASREYTNFNHWFRRTLAFSRAIDCFLDYFCEYGEPDDGSTEAALRALFEAIRDDDPI